MRRRRQFELPDWLHDFLYQARVKARPLVPVWKKVTEWPYTPAVAAGALVGLGGLWLVAPGSASEQHPDSWAQIGNAVQAVASYEASGDDWPAGSDRQPAGHLVESDGASYRLIPTGKSGVGMVEAAGNLPVRSQERPTPKTRKETSAMSGADRLAAGAAVSERPPPRKPAVPLGQVQFASAALRGSMPASFRKEAGREHGNSISILFGRIFMWHLNLRRELWPGDGLAAAWSLDERGKVVLEAARLESQKLKGTLEAYRYQATGDVFSSYWGPDGREVPLRLKRSPMPHYQQITSLLSDGRGHEGVDFMAPVGTKVVSPYSGTVTRVNWNIKANGRCVEVRYKDGTLAKFLHLEEVKVRKGQRLSSGGVVGLSGNTGRSTGPHLHYQLNRGSRVIDPVEYHGTTRRSLAESDIPGLEARIADLKGQL